MAASLQEILAPSAIAKIAKTLVEGRKNRIEEIHRLGYKTIMETLLEESLPKPDAIVEKKP